MRKKIGIRCGAALAALSLLASGGAASAGETYSGRISNIWMMPGGAVLFTHSGARSGTTPGCVTIPERWAFSATGDQGQAFLAALLSAYGLGKSIRIIGTANCGVWGDTETVQQFLIVD